MEHKILPQQDHSPERHATRSTQQSPEQVAKEFFTRVTKRSDVSELLQRLARK